PRLESSPFPLEDRRGAHSPAAHSEDKPGMKDSQAIADASPKAYRGGLRKIAARAADLADRKAEVDRLAEHLVVEDEAVGILPERQRLENPPGERAIAGVIFGELPPDENVLREGQATVPDVLVDRHAALERAPHEHPRPDHQIEQARAEHLDHGGD